MAWKSSARLLALSLVGLVAACGGGAQNEAPPAPRPAASAPAAPAAPAAASGYTEGAVSDGGTVAGKVTLTGTAPAAEAIEVTKDAAACGAEKKTETYVVGADGALANAVVWIDNIGKGKAWSNGGTVDQKDCHYQPHVQAVKVGGDLEIVNSDPVLHNIHAYLGGETLFNIAQPTQGQKTPKKLNQAGPVELKCDVHSWMHAWVFVAANPYFAVTGADGSFKLEQVPAGTYKVKVWHEGAGEKDMEVTVAAGATATADLALASAQ